MAKRSLRSALLTWNTGVVVVLLSTFGLGIIGFSQVRLRSELDSDLTNQGRDAQRLGPLPGGPPRRQPDDDLPEQFRPLFEPAQRMANIRQPRFFDREGNVLRPGRGQGRPFDGPDQEPPPDQENSPERPLNPDPVGQKLAFGGATVIRTVQWEDESLRIYSAPIIRNGETIGVVQTTRQLNEIDALLRSQLITLALMLPVAALVSAAAAVALANRALKPIAAVTRAASEIGSQDLRRRLEVVGDDELAEMSRTFNGMLERLDGAFHDIHAANDQLEKALESQRRFTADASHELRTPLTRMRLAADAVRSGEQDPQRLREALTITERAAGQMTRLVEQLLTLARVDAGQLTVIPERLDLRVVAAEALDEVPGAADRVIATFANEPVMVTADADHLRRIAVNLLENALRYAGEGAQIWLRVALEGGRPLLEVRDDGIGIPPEHLPKIFERFHRVDFSRTTTGSGLGLAICRDLTRANGAEIILESQPSVGTRVRVWLAHAQ